MLSVARTETTPGTRCTKSGSSSASVSVSTWPDELDRAVGDVHRHASRLEPERAPEHLGADLLGDFLVASGERANEIRSGDDSDQPVIIDDGKAIDSGVDHPARGRVDRHPRPDRDRGRGHRVARRLRSELALDAEIRLEEPAEQSFAMTLAALSHENVRFGDDPEDVLLVVDDREPRDPMLDEQCRHVLQRGTRRNGDDVRRHEIANLHVSSLSRRSSPRRTAQCIRAFTESRFGLSVVLESPALGSERVGRQRHHRLRCRARDRAGDRSRGAPSPRSFATAGAGPGRLERRGIRRHAGCERQPGFSRASIGACGERWPECSPACVFIVVASRYLHAQPSDHRARARFAEKTPSRRSRSSA